MTRRIHAPGFILAKILKSNITHRGATGGQAT